MEERWLRIASALPHLLPAKLPSFPAALKKNAF
jgi:hypothetical protein